MAIRVSGLVSGLDTDSIVQELVSAYSKKKDKHVKAQTKLEWKMDAWKDLNKKVNNLYKRLGNMKLSSYYNKKTTSISDSTKASVSASNNALTGTQTLKITEVAATGYLTGAQIDATADTTLGKLGLADGDKGTIAIKTKNGTKNIEVSSEMKISELVNKMKDAGVSASFDAKYGRFYVTAKDSGIENDFALTATDANGLKALKGLGLYVDSEANKEAYKAWDSYAVDINGNTKYTVDSNGKKIENPAFDPTNIDSAATKANFENILNTIDQYNGDGAGSIKELQKDNADLKTQMTGLQADRKYATAFMSMKGAIEAKKTDGTSVLSSTDQGKLESLLRKDNKDLTDAEKADLKQYQQDLGLSDKEFSKLSTNAKAVEAYEKDSENAQVVSEIHTAYNAADSTTALQNWVDGNTKDMEDLSKEMQDNADEIAQKQAYIKDNALLASSAPAATLTEDERKAMTDAQYAAFRAQDNADRADKLLAQFEYIQSVKNDTGNFSAGAVRVNGTDAVIELNGVEYQSASNSITINGLTVTALQKTAPGETLTVSTQADAQGIYDTIKDFLKEYNALIKEMDELYNADSAKGYEPLTDEEKEAMSDKEIEKWEEKIKGSILRRDDTLSTVMNMMTSSMAQGFTLSDGKKYSLASFGIKTQGYLDAADNEGSVYHIDGDKDDEISAGKSDKLLAAIQENPDLVQEFFQKLSDDLYTKLDKKMKSSAVNSRYSIYNDKKMQSDYDQYTKTIKKWEEKVTSMEEYYYKKFTAMEKALATLQQSTSALSGLLGS
ncbi:MAG: flagellar filament capping protein FliD [Lachnospiraceae bacterium]|nr:flagellar filament capping protein FliD [Lachnospiraceae bacterium]